MSQIEVVVCAKTPRDDIFVLLGRQEKQMPYVEYRRLSFAVGS